MKVIPKTLVDRADLKHINDLNLWWFAFLDDDWQMLEAKHAISDDLLQF